ncbi:MAG: ankyrin repeat domain-containing protein [Gammaproteobacteria bacterium]
MKVFAAFIVLAFVVSGCAKITIEPIPKKEFKPVGYYTPLYVGDMVAYGELCIRHAGMQKIRPDIARIQSEYRENKYYAEGYNKTTRNYGKYDLPWHGFKQWCKGDLSSHLTAIINQLECNLCRLVEQGYSLDVLRLLADEGNKDTLKKEGVPALIAASSQNKFGIVSALLDFGINPNERDKQGNTALMWAAGWGADDSIKQLLDGGANPNLASEDGHTSLIMAAKLQHKSSVKILLDSGADPNIRDSNGKTALYWAKHRNNPGIIEMLEQAGAWK